MKQQAELFQPYDPNSSPEQIKEFVDIATAKMEKGVTPDDKEVFEEWDNFCRSLKFSSARTMARLVDGKTFRAIRSYGQSLLGYNDHKKFEAVDMMNMTHPNQSKLLAYQTSNIIGLMMQQPELVPAGSAYYVLRSLLTRDRKSCWLVHQNTKPIQFDVNGRMTRFISAYTLLKEYEGEPLKTEVTLPEGYDEERKVVNSKLRHFKLGILQGLGFSRDQREIIEYLAEGIPNNEICEMMEFGEKALEKHRRKILKKAKDIFPMNDFKFAIHVVKYLQAQGVI